MDTGFYRKDGPYSWIVLAAIVVNNIVCMGFIFSTSGILVADYISHLGIEPTQAKLVGSLLLGIFLFSVPFNTLLVKHVGCRLISTLGLLLAITGLISSAFAVESWHLILGFALLTGLGTSMNMMCTIAIVPEYFHKRKNMAYMAGAIGAGIGLASYPIIYSLLRNQASYSDTILYLLPLLCCSISAPIVFKSQIPPEKPDSAKILLKNYSMPFRQYIMPFHSTNSALWNMTNVGISVLLYSYVKVADSDELAVQVQTVMGIMEVVGSLGLTLILLKVKVNLFLVQIGCNLMTGLACFILGAYPQKYVMFVMAGIIGFLDSITVGNIACLCSHLYKPAYVEYAFGFQEAIGGVGGFLGPFTAGLIQAKYGQSAGMWYLGALSTFGGILLIIAAAFHRQILTPCEIRLQTSDSQQEVE